MYNLSFEWHIRSSGPLCSSRISVDPVTFLSLELKYVTRYVMSPLASVHLRDGHFSDKLYKNKFLKLICLAKISNTESVKIVVITLLQRPVSAAAGFNSNHYFKLLGQTKSLPAPDTFCQLMVTLISTGKGWTIVPFVFFWGGQPDHSSVWAISGSPPKEAENAGVWSRPVHAFPINVHLSSANVSSVELSHPDSFT